MDRAKAPQRLKPLLSYIEEHLFDPTLDVNRLKHNCGVRDNSVPLQFHSAVGRPPYGYIEDRRLETACRLLGRTDLKIWQISELLGYSSIQVFSRAFSRWSGRRPTLYRNKARRAEGGQEAQTRAPAGKQQEKHAEAELGNFEALIDSSVRSNVEGARERYGQLVDKKFAASLGADEEGELSVLEHFLDHADAPIYEPVKQRLRAEIERLSAQRGGDDPR